MNKRLTRVYACGGAATNIMNKLGNVSGYPGLSDIEISFIDASNANLKNTQHKDNVYLLEGADGSGKVRSTNARDITASVKQILARQEPGDYNIVVFSLSGGSGSVIGPILMGELLANGKPAVALVVASTESKIETDNSIKTLKSLDGIARKQELPAVMYYAENSVTHKRSEIDTDVISAIMSLASLFSSDNLELDSRDLANFLQFTNAVGGDYGLVNMDIYDGNSIDQIKGSAPLSMASIYESADRTQLDITPDYYCYGARDVSLFSETEKRIVSDEDIHFVISRDALPTIIKRLNDKLSSSSKQQNARGLFNVLGDDDSVSDNGMVF